MFLLAAYGEVIVIAAFQFVVPSQDFGDFFGGIVRHVLGECGGKDALQVGLGKQTLHYGGVGGQHDVVLVHSHAVVSFGL